MKIVKNLNTSILKEKPEVSDKEAQEAFRIILRWIGENPDREGLRETPRRVTKAFKEYFKGYKQEITSELLKTLVMSTVMTTWFYKKIFQYKVIANIIWHQ